ncbi:MAG: nodulation protein NfeD [Deltaproteobacteria bacterium]|nr:nodulation protein NfeD [Deltaproteobacteria bacterium]
MRLRRALTAVLAAVLLFSSVQEPDSATRNAVHRMVINGTINPATSDFLRKSIEAARQDGRAPLLIELDTPGGILVSTQNMVEQILNSPVPIVVFVSPKGARAASAGTFILMSAHVAAMAPGTRVGAAHPVSAGGGEMGKDMAAKVEEDTAAFIASIAKQRGRNAEWAVSAVRESKAITDDEALKLNVVDLVAANTKALLGLIDGKTVKLDGEDLTLRTKDAKLVTHEMSFINRIIDTISHPNIAVLLFLGGLLGLYVEFTQPGLIFPGVAGVLSIILFGLAAEVLPMNSAGFLLVLLGVVLLVAEVFVTSFGLLFTGGIISLTLGLLIVFDTPAESDLRVSFWSVLFPAVLGVSLFGGVVAYGVTRSLLRPQRSGIEGFIGTRGEARSDLSTGGGKVFIVGEWWDAVSEEHIQTGEPIEVIGLDGMVLNVKKVKEDSK